MTTMAQETATSTSLGVGVRVRIADNAASRSDGGGYVHPAFQGAVGTIRFGVDATGCWTVALPNGNTNIIHGNFLTPLDDDDPAATQPEGDRPLESYYPAHLPVGTLVWAAGHGPGEVVAPPRDSTYVPQMIRQGRLVYVNTPRFGAVLMEVHDLALRPSLADLTVEQQLERLQRLIHRVASFEAVRRNWCNEVNDALAPLDLPAAYAEVDRDLGAYLRLHPAEIFDVGSLDGPMPPGPAPEPVEFEVDLAVDYVALVGFEVRGAQVCVHLDMTEADDLRQYRGEGDDEDSEDFDLEEWANDTLGRIRVEEAIKEAIEDDIDLPPPGSVTDWSVQFVNEV